MRGRKPTNATTLRLRGSRELNRAPRGDGPPSEHITKLNPPRKLEGLKLELWKKICADMASNRTLGQVSALVLARYIDLLHDWHTIDDAPHQNAIAAANLRCKLSSAMQKMENALGLNPESRRSVIPAPPTLEKDDPIQRIIDKMYSTPNETPDVDAQAEG